MTAKAKGTLCLTAATDNCPLFSALSSTQQAPLPLPLLGAKCKFCCLCISLENVTRSGSTFVPGSGA